MHVNKKKHWSRKKPKDTKLDAWQSTTLACLAVPLAACIKQHPHDFRLIVYGHSSTDPENMTKTDLVDFEIIDLT